MIFKNKLVLAVILALIAITAFALVSVPVKVSSVIYERSQEELNKQAKQKEFDRWLERLIVLECPDCKANFRRLDSNGEYSYACLQFQRRTFDGMARRYQIPLKLSAGDRSLEPIYSCDIQRKIATAMFRDDPKAAARHWYTSIYKKGLGLPPQ